METKLARIRFAPSKRDGNPISFLSTTKNGELKCVREDDKCKKVIVLATPEVKSDIVFGVQYNAEISQMKNGARGFVATKLTPITYAADIEVIYVRKCLYQIKIKWGNQTVIFDPKDGRRASVKDHNLIAAYLTNRVDILDRQYIVEKFLSLAKGLYTKLSGDGFLIL